MYDFASSGVVRYPAMAVVKNPFIYSSNTMTYSFNVYMMDLVHKDASNRTEVLSDMLQNCIDVLAMLDRDFDIVGKVVTDATFNDFIDSFDQEVSGYWFNLQIKTPYSLDSCAVPLKATFNEVSELLPDTNSTNTSTLYSGLVSYYTGNDTPNDSVSTNHLTWVGTPTYSTSQNGNGFSTISGRYLTANTTAWDLQEFSISMWVKRGAIPPTSPWILTNINYDGVQFTGWAIRIISNKFGFYPTYLGGEGSEVLTNTISTGNTYNVIVTFKSTGNYSIYLNGILQSTDTSLGSIDYTGVLKRVGVYEDTNSGVGSVLNGIIDDIGIWNRELTTNEITELQTTYLY